MRDMDPDGLSDELLERLRRRDETVLPALVNRHGPRLAATVAATWRGVPDHDAEEIVADVVADAWFHSDEVDPARASLATWLAMRAGERGRRSCPKPRQCRGIRRPLRRPLT
jgi:DNA-directed RNA polymerase specialized sigma24 family protein